MGVRPGFPAAFVARGERCRVSERKPWRLATAGAVVTFPFIFAGALTLGAARAAWRRVTGQGEAGHWKPGDHEACEVSAEEQRSFEFIAARYPSLGQRGASDREGTS